MLLPATLAVKPGQAITLRGTGTEQPSRVLRMAGRLEAGGVRRVVDDVRDAAGQLGCVASALGVLVPSLWAQARAGRGDGAAPEPSAQEKAELVADEQEERRAQDAI